MSGSGLYGLLESDLKSLARFLVGGLVQASEAHAKATQPFFDHLNEVSDHASQSGWFILIMRAFSFEKESMPVVIWSHCKTMTAATPVEGLFFPCSKGDFVGASALLMAHRLLVANQIPLTELLLRILLGVKHPFLSTEACAIALCSVFEKAGARLAPSVLEHLVSMESRNLLFSLCAQNPCLLNTIVEKKGKEFFKEYLQKLSLADFHASSFQSWETDSDLLSYYLNARIFEIGLLSQEDFERHGAEWSKLTTLLNHREKYIKASQVAWDNIISSVSRAAVTEQPPPNTPRKRPLGSRLAALKWGHGAFDSVAKRNKVDAEKVDAEADSVHTPE